jgi:hypothetical protein
MSYAEAMGWADYMRKRGSLNAGFRVEVGFALLAALVSKALGGRGEMADFMVSGREYEEEARIEDVMAILMGAKR